MSPAHLDAAAAVALGGPGWLVRRRTAALGAFGERALPTEDEEEWHYSRVAEIDVDAFLPPPVRSAPRLAGSVGADGDDGRDRAAGDRRRFPRAAEDLVARLGEVAGLVVTLDGVVERVEGSAPAREAGVVFGRLAGEQAPPKGLAPLDEAPDALSLLSEAFVADGALLQVPAGAVVGAPFVVVHHLTEAAATRLVAPRTIVEVGRGADATLVEMIVSGEDLVLVMPATELRLAEGAHLRAMSVQELGSGAIELASQRATLARDAGLVSFVAALGGGLARQRTHAVLAGANAESQLLAAYLADDRRVLSFRTVQEHLAPRTRSELVFKGAVGGEARSAYSGLVRIHRGARRSDASQTNRNLVLSDRARADSVPNLDILENDVLCSHASAVGPIDREQRFYLETRGVPTALAERLVLLGFFEEILQRAPSPVFAAHVREALPVRLARAAGERGGETLRGTAVADQ